MKNRPRRIVVIGSSCAGKTTFSQALSKTLGLKHIELDAFFWEPNWKEADPETFRNRVRAALASEESWVVDGNYTNKIKDLVWPQADTLIWLDPPLPVILKRLFSRSLKRVFTKEVLWSGCTETLTGAFFSRNSLFIWILKTRSHQRTSYSQFISNCPYPSLTTYHLRSSTEIRNFLAGLVCKQT